MPKNELKTKSLEPIISKKYSFPQLKFSLGFELAESTFIELAIPCAIWFKLKQNDNSI